jgi:two-component system copper resistance phosphate regulon response regulator CusR
MRLLTVEDDPKLAEFVARNLRAEKFIVDVAPDAHEALSLIESREYDLLLLDLLLPGRSGTEVLRQVRCSNPTLPILVLSACDAIEDKIRHFEAGVDDYLTKPFDMTELLLRIKALLRRVPGSRTDVILLANLELNRLTRQVHRGGRSIELTGKEYALLEYLLSSPNRVFSRSMILEHVWDQSFEGVTNIVDVYVRHLRRKVDDPFEVKLIHTVRGVGYSVGQRERGNL